MRFLGLLLTIALFSSLVYGIVFFWAQGRSYVAFRNEFLNQPKPWVFVPQGLIPEKTEIPWIEIEQDTDGLLKILPQKTPFADWLQKNNPKFFALNVMNSKPEIHEQISKLVPKEWDENVLIQSEIDVILASTKTLRARWLYGTSVADRVRWKSFDSVGLVGAVTFSRDVYVTSLRDRHGENLSESMVREIRKRKLSLVIGPLSTPEEVQLAKVFQPDGYIILNTDLRSQIR